MNISSVPAAAYPLAERLSAHYIPAVVLYSRHWLASFPTVNHRLPPTAHRPALNALFCYMLQRLLCFCSSTLYSCCCCCYCYCCIISYRKGCYAHLTTLSLLAFARRCHCHCVRWYPPLFLCHSNYNNYYPTAVAKWMVRFKMKFC